MREERKSKVYGKEWRRWERDGGKGDLIEKD